jgi:hypothetical protein
MHCHGGVARPNNSAKNQRLWFVASAVKPPIAPSRRACLLHNHQIIFKIANIFHKSGLIQAFRGMFALSFIIFTPQIDGLKMAYNEPKD